jgi:predicted transcriptional regulator
MSANATSQVRQRRCAAGLTQQRLAQLADCSISYVRLLERGYEPNDSTVAPRIMRALNDSSPGGDQGSSENGGGDRGAEIHP